LSVSTVLFSAAAAEANLEQDQGAPVPLGEQLDPLVPPSTVSAPFAGSMMKVILVPTDGSLAADKALDIALDLVEKHEAALVLMHVLLKDKEPNEILRLPELEGAGDDVTATLTEISKAPEPEHSVTELMGERDHPNRPVDEELLRRIGVHVLKRAEARAAARGVSAQLLDLQDGKPAKAIVAAAKASGADTIVMGTRGLRTIEAMAFGSVSQEVCRTAPCACVAVH
jgi:nucleotide-binding universal stress UspA family protein